MLEKIHIFISLIVGILYTVYAMVVGFEFFFWLKNVIIVMILFYILGLITRYYFRKILAPEVATEEIEVTEEDVEDSEEDDDEQPEQRPRKRFDFSRDEDDDEEN